MVVCVDDDAALLEKHFDSCTSCESVCQKDGWMKVKKRISERACACRVPGNVCIATLDEFAPCVHVAVRFLEVQRDSDADHAPARRLTGPGWVDAGV